MLDRKFYMSHTRLKISHTLFNMAIKIQRIRSHDTSVSALVRLIWGELLLKPLGPSHTQNVLMW